MSFPELSTFIERGLTPFHVSHYVSEILSEAGFAWYDPGSRWSGLDAPFFVVHEDGAVIAFSPGRTGLDGGVVVYAAHTDSPAYSVKHHGAAWRKGLMMLPTSPYGSPLAATWLDRPLAVAGRVATPDGRSVLFELSERVVIANLALHLNRKANEGISYNAQDHLVAIAGCDPDQSDGSAAGAFREMVVHAASLEEPEGCEIDALLAVSQSPHEIGTSGGLITAPRIDNLAGCHASLAAFLRADSARARVLVLYAHEEIGSRTSAGADSGLLRNFLQRIGRLDGADHEDVEVMLARSRVVSNDAAHAIHPSYADKYDPEYSPLLGGGPVVKQSGTYRYATTARTAAEFVRACDAAGVSVQRQANRSDIRSGSTVGPITWAQTGIPTVDVGIGILAMHSAVETAHLGDEDAMIRALTAFAQQT